MFRTLAVQYALRLQHQDTFFLSHYRYCSAVWNRSMDTGIGDRENTGRHLHPATKVCIRRSDGRTNRPAPKTNQPESARL